MRTISGIGGVEPVKTGCAPLQTARMFGKLDRQVSYLVDDLRHVEEQEAAEQLNTIVSYCKANNDTFVDDSFRPTGTHTALPTTHPAIYPAFTKISCFKE